MKIAKLTCSTLGLMVVFGVLSACTSPGYPCPLHDHTRSCLSELEAYQSSLKEQAVIPDRSLPYVIERFKPSQPQRRRFSWYGKMS